MAKGILGQEVQGRIARRIERSVESTIASLPDGLRAEYAEEWRAEMAATIAMPLSAAAFARGLRRSARELTAEATPVPSGMPSRVHGRRRTRGQPPRGFAVALLMMGAGGVLLVLDFLGDIPGDRAVAGAALLIGGTLSLLVNVWFANNNLR